MSVLVALKFLIFLVVTISLENICISVKMCEAKLFCIRLSCVSYIFLFEAL